MLARISATTATRVRIMNRCSFRVHTWETVIGFLSLGVYPDDRALYSCEPRAGGSLYALPVGGGSSSNRRSVAVPGQSPTRAMTSLASHASIRDRSPRPFPTTCCRSQQAARRSAHHSRGGATMKREWTHDELTEHWTPPLTRLSRGQRAVNRMPSPIRPPRMR